MLIGYLIMLKHLLIKKRGIFSKRYENLPIDSSKLKPHQIPDYIVDMEHEFWKHSDKSWAEIDKLLKENYHSSGKISNTNTKQR